MCLKNKITATALCALVAGIGIFTTNGNVVRANMPHTNLPEDNGTITLLLQQIESLKQQIQQIIKQIAILKPLETCGNGICRFGETAATCPADCGTSNCIKRGQNIDPSGTKKCCAGLIPLDGCFTDGVGATGYAGCSQGGSICGTLCGNGKCETGMGETAANCPKDCGNNATTCAPEGVTFYSGGKCCSGLTAVTYCPEGSCLSGELICTKCGDRICGTGETATNCPADCK